MGSSAVVQTAMLRCPFGSAPAILTVTSQPLVKICGMSAATIMDNKPLTFGTCSHPSYAAMTMSPTGPCLAAAQVVAPWTPGSLTVKICKLSALNNTHKLICNMGSVIEVSMTPAVTVNIG